MKSDNVIHFLERAGCPGGGKGILIQIGGAVHCLNTVSNDMVCYDITGVNSNSMKSPTPDSCFRERTVVRTLDGFVGSPECNQGGTVVVEKKPMYVDVRNGEVSETNGTLQAGAYHNNNSGNVVLEFTTGGWMHMTENVANTLMARDYKDTPCVVIKDD